MRFWPAIRSQLTLYHRQADVAHPAEGIPRKDVRREPLRVRG